MKSFLTLLFLLTASVATVQAKDTVIGGLSTRNVSINTTFTGSNILIFGTIKRGDSEEIVPSDIIIEVFGPETNITVRRKKKIFGIWVNSDPIKINNSPSFYSIVSTNKIDDILKKSEQLKLKIGRTQFFESKNSHSNYIEAINAQLRIKNKDGYYSFNNPPVKVKETSLFSASISLPANLTEGDYKTKIHLIQKGEVTNTSIDTIRVRKVGLERWLYKTAHNSPLFYGIFSVLLALFSGWGASTIFRRFQ